MKRLFYLLLLVPLFSVAQNPTTVDGWAQRLQLFGSKIPQEEVFIHMDNTCYYLGDTLYFKAYMRISDGRPSPLSHLLYVELLNHDGYLVERQKIEMTNGQGNGSFALPDTLYGGYYELRAYTRWQLNWGLFEHPHTKSAERWFYSTSMAKEYYRDYEKLYSRVFPVYDKPREAGEYDQNMTLRPMRRLVKQSTEKPKAVVTFYPEGGNLVADEPNRVAFEANDENGKHLNGRLKVNGEGLKVKVDVEAETVSRGRGSFVITPSAKEKLTATFTWDGGSQEVELPTAVLDGVAMQTKVEADGIHIALSPEGKAAYEELGLTVSCHGVMKDFQPISSNEILVPIEKLPTGVIQLTVFNFEGRVYADRLVFVRKPDFQPQNISFEGVKPQYEPYEEVSLSLTLSQGEGTTTGGGLSLAVRDAAHSDYTFDTGNILTEMLLSSQIRGFVEHPEYFFEADDEERRQALDLLLMVQGWRRYDWVTMATPGAFSIREPYEKTEILMGEVNTYNAEQQANSLMEAMDKREAEMSTGSDTSTGSEETEVSEVEKRLNEMRAESDKMLTEVDTRQGTTYRTDASQSENRFLRQLKKGGTLKNEAMLHAEFTQPGAKEGESMVEGEMDTYNHGSFKIEAPKFYDRCLLFYAAINPKDYKGEKHPWRSVNEDSKGNLNYPPYYAKLNWIYPRFVKPYNFYQTAVPKARPVRKELHFLTDDIFVMDEVTVGARRGGLRTFDATKPAFVLDAYEAFNAACDAGLCPGYYIGFGRFANDVARTYIGDMNMERPYEIERRFESKTLSAYFSDVQLDMYNHLPRLDMIYVYTDYSPRREGDKRYSQDNQPIVTVDFRGFTDGGQRMTYSDRFMLLSGYAVCEDFYNPDYSKQKPAEPKDYRRTLYWNPNVKLDNEGKAKVSFFTGSRPTQLILSAEGLSGSGQPLTGLSYPEDR